MEFDDIVLFSRSYRDSDEGWNENMEVHEQSELFAAWFCPTAKEKRAQDIAESDNIKKLEQFSWHTPAFLNAVSILNRLAQRSQGSIEVVVAPHDPLCRITIEADDLVYFDQELFEFFSKKNFSLGISAITQNDKDCSVLFFTCYIDQL